MKRLYGFHGSSPEYYVVSKLKQKAFVIIENPKRKKLFLNDAKVYGDYLGKKIIISELPTTIDEYNLELQTKRNHTLTQIIKSKKPAIIISDKISTILKLEKTS